MKTGAYTLYTLRWIYLIELHPMLQQNHATNRETNPTKLEAYQSIHLMSPNSQKIDRKRRVTHISWGKYNKFLRLRKRSSSYRHRLRANDYILQGFPYQHLHKYLTVKRPTKRIVNNFSTLNIM